MSEATDIFERGGQMADYFELIKKRRAIREYEDRKVSLNEIKAIIKESTLAPSSGNGQPWKFIVIEDPIWIKPDSHDGKTPRFSGREV